MSNGNQLDQSLGQGVSNVGSRKPSVAEKTMRVRSMKEAESSGSEAYEHLYKGTTYEQVASELLGAYSKQSGATTRGRGVADQQQTVYRLAHQLRNIEQIGDSRGTQTITSKFRDLYEGVSRALSSVDGADRFDINDPTVSGLFMYLAGGVVKGDVGALAEMHPMLGHNDSIVKMDLVAKRDVGGITSGTVLSSVDGTYTPGYTTQYIQQDFPISSGDQNFNLNIPLPADVFIAGGSVVVRAVTIETAESAEVPVAVMKEDTNEGRAPGVLVGFGGSGTVNYTSGDIAINLDAAVGTIDSGRIRVFALVTADHDKVKEDARLPLISSSYNKVSLTATTRLIGIDNNIIRDLTANKTLGSGYEASQDVRQAVQDLHTADRAGELTRLIDNSSSNSYVYEGGSSQAVQDNPGQYPLGRFNFTYTVNEMMSQMVKETGQYPDTIVVGTGIKALLTTFGTDEFQPVSTEGMVGEHLCGVWKTLGLNVVVSPRTLGENFAKLYLKKNFAIGDYISNIEGLPVPKPFAFEEYMGSLQALQIVYGLKHTYSLEAKDLFKPIRSKVIF